MQRKPEGQRLAQQRVSHGLGRLSNTPSTGVYTKPGKAIGHKSPKTPKHSCVPYRGGGGFCTGVISPGKCWGWGRISPPLGIPKLQHLHYTANTPKFHWGKYRNLAKRKLYCLWQVHLAENLRQAMHTKIGGKTHLLPQQPCLHPSQWAPRGRQGRQKLPILQKCLKSA